MCFFLSCLFVAYISLVISVVLLLICKSSLVLRKSALLSLVLELLFVGGILYRVKLKIFVFYESFYFAG